MEMEEMEEIMVKVVLVSREGIRALANLTPTMVQDNKLVTLETQDLILPQVTMEQTNDVMVL